MAEKDAQILTCIRCPRGCQVSVAADGGGQVLSVSGNLCARGGAYARAEVTNPVRTVTTTVPVEGGRTARVSVKTEHEVPRDAVMDVMRALAGVTASAPVEIGDVVVSNVAGTGVDLVATSRA